MRILFVCSGNTKNGVSPVVKAQGESLIQFGESVDYFAVKEKGIKGYLKAASQLREYLKTNSYDVIHSHYGLSGLSALLGNNSHPLVISFMGDDILGSNRADGKLSLISKQLIKLNSFLSRYKYDHTIVKSDKMLKNIHHDNFTILPNGVNIQKFYPVDKNSARYQLKLAPDKKIVLFVSNPARPEKNFTLAKNAVNNLHGSEVELIPVYNKPHKEINLWMNAADVLLLTSFHEGSPNVIKEAMACNCPIVATNVGDVEYIFGDTEGCYISSYEPKEFSEKIKQAFNFAETQGRTNGRERILELGLDSESIAKKLVAIYKKVLTNNKQS